jgi:hypothetical protein
MLASCGFGEADTRPTSGSCTLGLRPSRICVASYNSYQCLHLRRLF